MLTRRCKSTQAGKFSSEWQTLNCFVLNLQKALWSPAKSASAFLGAPNSQTTRLVWCTRWEFRIRKGTFLRPDTDLNCLLLRGYQGSNGSSWGAINGLCLAKNFPMSSLCLTLHYLRNTSASFYGTPQFDFKILHFRHYMRRLQSRAIAWLRHTDSVWRR